MRATITENLLFRFRQMKYWTKMLVGKSYYHKPQVLGKVFEPGKLKGYFSDLTGRTTWEGEVDQDGVPVSTLYDGRRIQLPILITHNALGHYDQWLVKEQDKDKQQFLALSNWLVKNQDENGGWDTWGIMKGQTLLKYSAMTQGEALSVLSRAFKLTDDSRFKQTAEKAVNLFWVSVKDGGITYFENGKVFLEETPAQPRNTILNGWIFSLFCLYDFNLIFDDSRVTDMFERSIRTLAQHLPEYDNGYWTYYDSRKHLASPHYHRLHINQVEALCLISDKPVFKEYHQRWINYQGKLTNRSRAFVLKALQKLKEPATTNILK